MSMKRNKKGSSLSLMDIMEADNDDDDDDNDNQSISLPGVGDGKNESLSSSSERIGETQNKKGGGWFSRLRGGTGKGSALDVEESEGGNDNIHNDPEDASSVIHSSTQRSVTPSTSRLNDRSKVETIENYETEFHQAIRDHDWDELESLLKDYSYETFKKLPPKPKKKRTKRLRIAKYLPEIPEWRKEKQVPISPLLGLDALGRTPLHLCCVEPVPSKLLIRVMNSARDAAAVKDSTESLPIHLAIQHERGVDVIDKLVRGYFQGSWTGDGRGLTPLMWAVEIAKKKQKDNNLKPTGTYWGFPISPKDVNWQERQTKMWEVVQFLIHNRSARHKKLLPCEFGQLTIALSQAAPPEVISLMISTGKNALKKDEIAGKALFLMISRQYSIELLQALIEVITPGFAKLQKDPTGRGVVAAHYRVGCMSHQDDPQHKLESFRVTMQQLANAKNNLDDQFVPPPQYSEWWEKLKLLINLWGTHITTDDEEEKQNYFHVDELLLHNALINPDVPPSLIQLLASLYADSPDLEHPKSHALPIHLACRLWKYREYPPRKGDREISMDRVTLQLIEGDPSRTRKRFRDRLPLHHALAMGKSWDFIKPLVTHDRKSLQVRDPITKLLPFQLAAMKIETTYDIEELTRQSFAPSVWNRMRDYEQDHEMRKVLHHYDLQQFSLIFELLRHSPDSISYETILRQTAEKRDLGKQRRPAPQSLEVSDDVVTTTQMKLVRSMFGLGNVSGHFIGWCYENTVKGWKPHRRNFAVVKEAILDGFVPMNMDKWWRKLKFWLWRDCPWNNIPRRDEFLLHCALCNPEVSPWIIELLLECFPRSASIPLPGSNGCYPLHIACVTITYVPLPFEFPNNRNAIEMVAKCYRDAMLLKWNNQLPIHLAISKSKQWSEIRFLAEDEPVSLAVPESENDFFAFQFMALHRPYTRMQRRRFENIAMKQLGNDVWKNCSPEEKVQYLKSVLDLHETTVLGSIFELLKRNPMLVSIGIVDPGKKCNVGVTSYSVLQPSKPSSSKWLDKTDSNLSMASLQFLEEIYEKDSSKTEFEEDQQRWERSISLSDLEHRHEGTGQQLEESDGYQEFEQQFGPEETFLRDIQDEVYQTRGDRIQLSPSATLPIGDIQSIQTTDENEDTQQNPKIDGLLHHPLLTTCRCKKMIVVSKSSAFLIDETSVLSVNAANQSANSWSRSNQWLRLLQGLGEMISAETLHVQRRNSEQCVIGVKYSDGTPTFIDEDESYLWVMRGKDAISYVEGYRIDSAAALADVFEDNETECWLYDFQHYEKLSTLIDNNDYDLLSWILKVTEAPLARPNTRKFQKYSLSKTMLRRALAPSQNNVHTEYRIDDVPLNGARKLMFDLAIAKMHSRFNKRRRVRVGYQVSRGLCFERQKEKFYEIQNHSKLLSRLRKKQKAARSKTKKKIKVGKNSQVSLQRESSNCFQGTHLEKVNQPKTKYEDDNRSLDEDELFLDVHEAELPAKPLLTAALKAKEQVDKQKYSVQGTHLEKVNQPKTKYEDDNRSLDEDELFLDVHEAELPAKPLLTAALKAKDQQKHFAHLAKVNQPKTKYEDDNRSLDEDELFLDVHEAELPAKPLLTAALKANDQQKHFAHLAKVNQPKTKYEDDNRSLDEDELFLDVHEAELPAKPLLTAALKAKDQQKHFVHLAKVNQPKTKYEDDNRSLDEDELFLDVHEAELPAKPLLTAALKAKDQQKHFAHLAKVNQPKTKYEDDNRSLDEDELFLDVHEAELPAKPLLTAALKANDQQKHFAHLAKVNQPKTKYEDDNRSLDEDELFLDVHEAELPAKPLLTAALKAKDQQRHFAHLAKVNQPKTKYEDDNRSLDEDELFLDVHEAELPAKPLLTAALKAKDQQRHFAHLAKVNQPKTKYEDDNRSLDEDELFLDVHEAELPAKPLLTAALKAKDQQRHFAHLAKVNQPKTKYEDDNRSLDEDELFLDVHEAELPAKPLLTAALKAKDQQRHFAHLAKVNQPKTKYEDDNRSLDEDELFSDLKEADLPAKPLLTAALKAKEQADEKKYNVHGTHLEILNHSRTKDGDEDTSTGGDFLFEVIDGSVPAKPIVTAGLTAEEAILQENYSVRTFHMNELHLVGSLAEEKSMDEEDLFYNQLGDSPAEPALSASVLATEQSNQNKFFLEGEHLKSLNQPKVLLSEEKSIDEYDLFDEPLEKPPRKPLLAAAHKAREEQRSRLRDAGGNGSNTHHLQYICQPPRLPEEDDASLVANEIFDPPSPPIRKPLLTAAKLAKRQQEVKHAPEHLRYLCQPQAGDLLDDESSLDIVDVFEPVGPPPPRKPMLAAALRAKEAADERARIIGMSQDGTWISGVDSSMPARQAAQRRPLAMTAELIRKNSFDNNRLPSKKRATKKKPKRSTEIESGPEREGSNSPKKKITSKASSKVDKKDPNAGGFFSRMGGKKNG
ncbi:ankyrin repeat domain protein [Nitzschia inconspicua]|uniref:Ankyrin repeat domain protein n=1 Tax=Nitzschia inconspicua TaxID=303405 RepID=A0A9K3PI43_9STRA|nr:ankyrin repeat domain protein [Nitzschia inconspicua]